MVVLLVQILLGTQVREAIDQIAESVAREAWIASLNGEFMIHRSFSWIVLILNGGLALKLRKTQESNAFTLTLILLILGTILTGVGMAYFAIPPFLQPVHLLLATASFGMQFLFLLKINRKNEPVFS
jgi:cytochrome c oxidase assembly protein subunit 15